MTKVQKYIAFILGVVAILSLGWKIGTPHLVRVGDTQWARVEDFALVAMRLDQKIDKDRIEWLQEQIEDLKKDFKNRRMPESVQKSISNYEEEIKVRYKKWEDRK